MHADGSLIPKMCADRLRHWRSVYRKAQSSSIAYMALCSAAGMLGFTKSSYGGGSDMADVKLGAFRAGAAGGWARGSWLGRLKASALVGASAAAISVATAAFPGAAQAAGAADTGSTAVS